MKPELPVELLDYIFTFMRDDHPSLKACANVSHAFSEIVEKHLYYEVSLYNSDSLNAEGELTPAHFLKLFTNQPRIASHVRSLRISIAAMGFFTWLVSRTMNEDDITHLLPRISHLRRISLMGRRNDKISWGRLQLFFQTSFVVTLRSPSLVDVSIIRVEDFPLKLLDSCKSLKHLSLSGSFTFKVDDATGQNSVSNSTYVVRAQLKSLLIRHCSPSADELLGWLQSGSSPDISSLVCLKATIQSQEDYSLVAGILKVCSTSLKELELSPEGGVHTIYNMNDQIIPPYAALDQLVDLSTIAGLNSFTIVSYIGSLEDFWISSNGEETIEDCIYSTPFSWILRQMETLARLRTNSLEYIILELSFNIDRRSLERVNWGHLTSAFNLKLLPFLRNVELRAACIKTSTVDLPILMQALRTDPYLSPLIGSGLWSLTGQDCQA